MEYTYSFEKIFHKDSVTHRTYSEECVEHISFFKWKFYVALKWWLTDSMNATVPDEPNDSFYSNIMYLRSKKWN